MQFCMLMLVMASLYQIPSAHNQAETLQRYWVEHEGRNIEVYGYMNAAGKVVWNPETIRPKPRERRDSPAETGEKRPSAVVIVEPTCGVGQALPAWQVNGVNRPKSEPRIDRYTAHSNEAKRFVAESVEGPSNGKLHVTIVGNADERARVTNDIKTNAAFDGIRDDMLVQDYDPKDWPVDPKLGFLPGKPTIIVQAGKGPNDPKGGRVIYRTLDYTIGPKGLAEAIRNRNPDYKPDLDPGPNTSPLPSILAGLPLTAETIMIGVVIALLLWPKKGA